MKRKWEALVILAALFLIAFCFTASAAEVSTKKAFGKDKITCMLCGKEMKTLARHLKTAHDMKPGEYRKQFEIPRNK